MTKHNSRAERLAKEALSKTKETIPVNVTRVAEHYGLLIHKQELEDVVSGILLVREKRAIISVNRNHHLNRQRFTIAHEIGHYLMHTNQSQLFIENLSLYRNQLSESGTNAIEIEANAFAAELLMPTKVLITLIAGQLIDAFYDEQMIRLLASKFGVSTQAMTVKMSKLNLIQ